MEVNETAVDPAKYGQLLAMVRPGVIETEEEGERLLAMLDGLLDRGDNLTPEEDKLAALLTLLIEAYQGGYGEEPGEDDEEEPDSPHEVLKGLMHTRGLQPVDLTDVFGNPRVVQEVLNGDREISRGQARQLAQLFDVPAQAFLG